MTWFADLSPFDYFGPEAAAVLLPVGWLGVGHEYTKGPVATEVYGRLVELLKDPWQPFVSMGKHACDLCRFSPEASASENLFIPHGPQIMVCPKLILHYINTHEHQPPEEFCAAIQACPDTRSMEYKRQLLRSGGRVLLSAAGRDVM